MESALEPSPEEDRRQASPSSRSGALVAFPLNDVSSRETPKNMCRSNGDWGG